MFANFPAQLAASSLRRHLFFLAATIATVLLIGYHFGTFDEAMHIPFLKYMADPTLYPGDSMLGLSQIYYSYFWPMFVPVLRAGLLEPTLFIVHVLTIYLSYWAIWRLSDTLFHNPRVSALSVIGLVVPHFSFVGFPVFEFAPLSRTFVLPFLIFAMDQFLRGRVPLAFLIAGLMYNIHVVSVNFILAMFGLACLLEMRRIGWKSIALGAFLFVVSALPVLLWKAGGDPVDFSLRPAWVDFLIQTLFLNIFQMFGPYPGIWAVNLSGLAALALFFIAQPRADSPSPATTARNFIYAGILVVLANVFAVNSLPVTILIQSQIARIGLWILILAYLFFADYLVRIQAEGRLSPLAFVLLLGVYIFSPTPALVLLVWALVMFVSNQRIIRLFAALTPALILAGYLTVWAVDFWTPGIYIYGKQTPWVQAQHWARENTPRTARFLTPPEKWGLQESDWRVHSERASVATLSELLVAAFEPGYEETWLPRFEILAPGALAQFNGDYFSNVAFTREAYRSLDGPALQRAACHFLAEYIVVQKPADHPFVVAYENSEYIIYDLRPLACAN